MLDNARAMADAGATVAVATAPGYFNYSPQEIEAIFTQFADASPLPVMIYDIPAFAGAKLSLDFVLRMARHENIVGFKDSSADSERFEKLLAALGESSDFWLLQGKENLLAEFDPRRRIGICRQPAAYRRGAVCGPLRGRALGKHGSGAATSSARHSPIRKRHGLLRPNGPRPSTLFHLLNAALRQRGVCDNILLEHEGETPDWIEETLRASQNDDAAG